MMRLDDYRKSLGLSYENLARELDFTTNKTFRICKNKSTVKLEDAHRIVQKTGGRVDYPDMLVQEDC